MEGLRFTGTGDFSSRSIFIPSVGYGTTTSLEMPGEKRKKYVLWCSNAPKSNTSYASYYLYYYFKTYYASDDGTYEIGVDTAGRSSGMQIRPVIGATE